MSTFSYIVYTFVLTLILFNFCTAQAILKGQITLNYKCGLPLENVQIVANYTNPTATDKFGRFELKFQDKKPGDKIILSVLKKGFEAVNLKDLEVALKKNVDELTEIIMCKEGDREIYASIYYDIQIENKGRKEQAAKDLLDMIKKLEELENKNPQFYIPKIARAYLELGNLLLRDNEKCLAIEYFKKFAENYKKMDDQNKISYKLDLSNCYHQLGELYFEINSYENSAEFFLKALEMRIEYSKKNSISHWSDLAHTYHMLGNVYVKLERYKESVLNYQETLQIRKKLNKLIPGRFDFDICSTYLRLAYCFKQILDKVEEKDKLSVCKQANELINSSLTILESYKDEKNNYNAQRYLNETYFLKKLFQELEKNIIF